MHTRSWRGNPSEKEDLDVDGNNNKMDLKRNGGGGMDWIDLAQDTDSWRALLNVVLNLRFPSNARNFLKCGGLVRFS